MTDKKILITKNKNEICPLVEAACCIAANGKGYDIDKQFNSWVKDYIKEKLSPKTADSSENNKRAGKEKNE